MPLPSKNKTQSDQEFMDSCLSNETVNKEFPDNSQRFAVCKSILKRSKKKNVGSFEELYVLEGMDRVIIS